MNPILRFDGIALWQVAGWTMLHFLWLGTLVGLIAFACRVLLRRAKAELKYTVALATLAVLAALPAAIGTWLAAKPQAGTLAIFDVADGGEIIELNSTSTMAIEPQALGFAGGSVAEDVTISAAARPNPRQSRGLTDVLATLETCVAYLPWLWLIGTPLTFALLATGIIGAERLRRSSRTIDDGQIAEACARLRQSLGVTRRVAVAVCERIAAPVLVGILRPIILLPPSALTGWSPDEIEMVLLHELAHVRRWDNLVNFAQRVIESLLFFHPAVWLVSGWVRREREACCDAAVVRRTNRPHAYAELLVALATQMPRSVLFHPAASSAMAAGPLRTRIRRILKLEDDPMLVSGKSIAFVTVMLLIAASLLVVYLPARGSAEESDAAHTSASIETALAEPTQAGASDDAEGAIRPDSKSTTDGVSTAKFPTLDDQKLADLAWKQLRLELEPINDEELRHAQGRGYEGGVRVTALGSPSFQQNYIQMGDILVGLHVWPTRNMQDVVAVLRRTDLAELNPLKFYVLRPDRGANGQGGLVLHQVTGRIAAVAPAASADSSQPQKSAVESRSVDELAVQRMKADPQAAKLQHELFTVQTRLMELRTAHGAASPAVVQANRQIAALQQQLAQYRAAVTKRIVEQRRGTFDHGPQNSPDDIDRPQVDTLELLTESQPVPPLDVSSPTDPKVESANSASDPVDKQAPSKANRSLLRYDGKVFNAWRDIWQNELSSERRLEAVKALAAFAAAGYGAEATETILEVAGEYDFRTSVDSASPEGQLRTQIVRTLAAGKGIDPTDVFDKIAKRYDESPPKFHGLLVKFLSRPAKLDASVLSRVRALLKHKAADVRAAALAAVAASDPAQMSATIRAGLADPDPQVVSRAVQILDRDEQLRRENEEGARNEVAESEFPVDEFVQLLLRTPSGRDRTGNRTVFTVLSGLSTETAERLTNRLVQIIKDPALEADHLTAIRALGLMRKRAKAAQPELERILNDDSEEIQIRVAAATALDAFEGRHGQNGRRLVPPRQRTRPQVDDQELARQREEREEIERLHMEEQNLHLNR